MAIYKALAQAFNAGQTIDVFANTVLEQLQEDTRLDLWLSATADLATVTMSIIPPDANSRTLIRPNYVINVESNELDDEWDIVVRGLELKKLTLMSMPVTFPSAGTLMWKVNAKRAPAPVTVNPELTIDGGSVSIPALNQAAPVDLFAGVVAGTSTALRRFASPRVLSLLASAAAPGLTIQVQETGSFSFDLVQAGYPINVRTEAISVPKDRIIGGMPSSDNAVLSALVTNPTAAAILMRWHAASVPV